MIKSVDVFFINGYFNNIMNPCDNYWRICYKGAVKKLMEKLDSVKTSLEEI